MKLNGETREGILGVEEEIYKITGISCTRSKQKKIKMEVNASDYAIEEVLSMECKNSIEFLVQNCLFYIY